MPLFVKIESGIVDRQTFDRFVPAHKDYVRKLIDEGRRAKSGYWGDFGGGMLLFEAESFAEAESIVREDPLIKNHCVKYELHEWRVVVE
jgi:uncharacterized protein YciI